MLQCSMSCSHIRLEFSMKSMILIAPIAGVLTLFVVGLVGRLATAGAARRLATANGIIPGDAPAPAATGRPPETVAQDDAIQPSWSVFMRGL
jgi:hypothetical protein